MALSLRRLAKDLMTNWQNAANFKRRYRGMDPLPGDIYASFNPTTFYNVGNSN